MRYKIENYVEQNCIIISLDGNLCVVESETGLSSEEILDILLNDDWSMPPITMERIVYLSLKLEWNLE